MTRTCGLCLRLYTRGRVLVFIQVTGTCNRVTHRRGERMASDLVVVCPRPLHVCPKALNRRRLHVDVQTQGLQRLALCSAHVAGIGPHLHFRKFTQQQNPSQIHHDDSSANQMKTTIKSDRRVASDMKRQQKHQPHVPTTASCRAASSCLVCDTAVLPVTTTTTSKCCWVFLLW